MESTSPFTKKGCSNFASGFDRWLTLQSVSEKMNRRAGTLNAMEKIRLDRATRQIDYKLNMSEYHHSKACHRLKDTLKYQDLYKRALNRNRRVKDEAPHPKPTDNSIGRYRASRSYRTLEDDIMEEQNEMRESRRRRTAKLLEESRKESDTLIDRRVPTHHLLGNKGAPLSQRLRTNANLRLRIMKPKMQALVAFSDLRESVAKKKDEHKGEKVKMKSKGTFQCELSDI